MLEAHITDLFQEDTEPGTLELGACYWKLGFHTGVDEVQILFIYLGNKLAEHGTVRGAANTVGTVVTACDLEWKQAR